MISQPLIKLKIFIVKHTALILIVIKSINL